jgi:hypothetical protein
MTTYDPGTLEQDISVLQKIYGELGGRTALDLYVLRPGPIRVGDPAEIGDWWTLECASHASRSSTGSRAEPGDKCAWEDSNPRPAA